MTDQEQMQADLLAQERLFLDCLMACHKGGNEKSATILAAGLGLSQQFDQEKSLLQRKAA